MNHKHEKERQILKEIAQIYYTTVTRASEATRWISLAASFQF